MKTMKATLNATTSGARARKQTGVSLLELPLAMWLMFGLLVMPMLGLATMTLKSALMNAAVQDGVQIASKARTYDAGTPDKPSALMLAGPIIKNAASKWSGMTIDSITTEIVITPLNGGAVTRQTTKLTQPADTSVNIYQIETVVKGRIEPLLNLNAGVIGNIPGLSTPMIVSFTARQMAENPQGLNR